MKVIKLNEALFENAQVVNNLAGLVTKDQALVFYASDKPFFGYYEDGVFEDGYTGEQFDEDQVTKVILLEQ